MSNLPLTSLPAGWPAYRLSGSSLERWDGYIGRYVSFLRADADHFAMSHMIECQKAMSLGDRRKAVRERLACDDLAATLGEYRYRMSQGNVVHLADYRKPNTNNGVKQ